MAWEDMPDSLIDTLLEHDRADWHSLPIEQQIEINRKVHDAIRDAGYLPNGYKVRPLTAEDIRRAASVVLAIASIPTLKRGVVAFEDGLEGGRWYDDLDRAYDSEQYLVVDIPESLDLASARAAVLDGIQVAREFVEHCMGDPGAAPSDASDRALELRALEVEGAMSEAVA
jgi:hypothetical protein